MANPTNGNDVVRGTAGNDILKGLGGDDRLEGLGGNDVLNGGAGADRMIGGLGNDTYYVDNVGDRPIENVDAGTDTVRSSINYVLRANLENLVLTGTAALKGTGNEVANVLTGNAGANVLDGRAGADTMRGGNGNDTYVVDAAGDRVIESVATGGTELVKSSVSFTLGDNVENLALFGSAAARATGNGLANVLTGNGAANVLDGRGGADTMRGGNGNDTYVVNATGDRVIENSAAGGVDSVRSSVDFTLGSNVENLTLLGSGAIDGTGNSLANRIVGNGAANRITGGGGDDVLTGGRGGDTLIGGAGADRLAYHSAAESSSVHYDNVVGFDYRVDTVDLPVDVLGFAGELEGGRLSSSTFDADLSAAIGDLLPAGFCGIFIPDSGNLAGKEFFVVDGNGEAGYQAGQDFVFLLTNPVAIPDGAPFPVDVFV